MAAENVEFGPPLAQSQQRLNALTYAVSVSAEQP